MGAIEEIGEVLKSASNGESTSFNVGVITTELAYKTMEVEKKKPNPNPLWLTLWNEGELNCLFSDSNLGKSIYAVQIANEISKTRKVIYFDFELSGKQFQMRYTDDSGNLFKFNDNFYRATIDPLSIGSENFEDSIINSIEATALRLGANVLIIDNLTYMCAAAEKGDKARLLMMSLMKLKLTYNFSMLVIAHTPKRNTSEPLEKKHLAGSANLINFFDGMIAIGQSAKDKNLRYVKQLKVRGGAFTHDEDVMICSIEKEGAFLHFKQIGIASEREHLREVTEKDRSDTIEEVKNLDKKGKSQREISTILGLSLGCVNKYLKCSR